MLRIGSIIVTAVFCWSASAESPRAQRLTPDELTGSVFEDSRTVRGDETSEAGTVVSLDLPWHTSTDGCMQTGVYETGRNRYTIDEPYPHDELMIFLQGGVTLTEPTGEALTIGPGDAVMIPKGWLGVWDSDGYRKVYVIYDCPD
jgi:uncharacterized cupin superfamily protein